MIITNRRQTFIAIRHMNIQHFVTKEKGEHIERHIAELIVLPYMYYLSFRKRTANIKL